MRKPGITVFVGMVLVVPWSWAGTKEPAQLLVPDGQIRSHPLRVFVTSELSEGMRPKLVLAAARTLTGPPKAEQVGWTPTFIAPRQKWTEAVEGQLVAYEGTLLLFDVSRLAMPWWKPMTRLTPILSWEGGEGDQKQTENVIGSREVYLGNLPVAALWTLLLVTVLVLMLGLWARRKTGHARFLLCGPDHYYSLWRVQLAAWTLTVGGMVFCFGMIRLAVPSIPGSLVALMGLSLATGTITAAKARSDAYPKAAQVPATPSTAPPSGSFAVPPGPAPAVTSPPRQVMMNPGLPAFADLVADYDAGLGRVVLSIPKAQMVFWTVVVLLLFIAKTLLNGQLWDVPWEMVGLTGLSQAGYIGGKFTKGQPS